MAYSVLIVDDEKDLAEICCEIFEIEGFEVFSADNARTALELYKEHEIDVIISDARMPNMSGFEFFAHIKEGGRMPLFYLSTGVVDLDIDDLINQGVTAVVHKPYNVDDLVERVRKDLKNLS